MATYRCQDELMLLFRSLPGYQPAIQTSTPAVTCIADWIELVFMAKNCSKCKSRHLPPFGIRCKIMTAVIEGFDCKDEKYLQFLEDEYCRRKREDDLIAKGAMKSDPSLPIPPHSPETKRALDDIAESLHQLTDRVGKIELQSKKTTTTSTDLGATAADLLGAPLSQALAKLSGHDDDRGRHLRPEFYSQSYMKDKQQDFTKMDTIDLFYGWLCVADHLVATGGDLTGYLKHIKYATEMLHSRKFFDSGAIRYDRMVIDKYLSAKSGSFNPDPVLSSLTFASQVIPDYTEICHGGSLTKGVTSFVNKNPRRRRMGGFQQKKVDEVPADFPSDICFFYNYRHCADDSCNKAHICRKCFAKHRADTCKERSKNS